MSTTSKASFHHDFKGNYPVVAPPQDTPEMKALRRQATIERYRLWARLQPQVEATPEYKILQRLGMWKTTQALASEMGMSLKEIRGHIAHLVRHSLVERLRVCGTNMYRKIGPNAHGSEVVIDAAG